MRTKNRFAPIGGWSSAPESCCGSMTDWRVKAVILALALCGLAPKSFGQGVLQITFDGPPTVAPGTGVVVTNYSEAGMLFQPLPGSRGFSRWGAATDPRDPNNGTAFVRAALGQSLMFNFTNGSAFEMLSVDLAGYSSVVPDATIQFVGYRADGSTVRTNVDRHGIVFDTMYFGPEFSDLMRVEIPNSLWSLDNLTVSVPEPSAGALWVLGLAFGAFVFGRSRQVVSTALSGGEGQCNIRAKARRVKCHN
jgi:hypothetical protein